MPTVSWPRQAEPPGRGLPGPVERPGDPLPPPIRVDSEIGAVEPLARGVVRGEVEPSQELGEAVLRMAEIEVQPQGGGRRDRPVRARQGDELALGKISPCFR